MRLTPEAFANFSLGFEEREPWDRKLNSLLTLKGFANLQNPFRVVECFLVVDPGLSLALQPWAEISERLQRYSERLRRYLSQNRRN